ncbi:MAG TPA: polysaccharide biosynthesis/export family protein [Candidatus Dormibacteraeota bacterium]|nr:polysaccharide biosynthesis/export family protein [Candidatus Dormibacteraeota bacterium]
MKINIARYWLLSLVFANVMATAPVAQTMALVSSSPDAQTRLPNAATHPLQIAAGDLLDVNVFDTPELSAKLRVDERDSITLPLAGDLQVSGMTAEQAGHAIETKLLATEILKDPHVMVTVIEYATQGVTVLGEVKNPGVYPLLGAHGVLDLISAAGGLTPTAGKAVAITHRGESDKPVVVKIETKPASTAAFNIDVRPGDTIMVSHAGIVYVVGDVAKPGGFLIENNDRLTVLQAIALAQGTNRTASLNHAKLIRKTDTGREEIPVPLKKILANNATDQMLADGDILFIPGSAAKNALRAMETVLPSVASAAIYRVPLK